MAFVGRSVGGDGGGWWVMRGSGWWMVGVPAVAAVVRNQGQTFLVVACYSCSCVC